MKKIIKKLNKKGDEGMPWYLIAAILALVFMIVAFFILKKSYDSGTSIFDGLRGMF